MDYATVTEGDVVLNCGVHGGAEIPYFLAGLAGRGILLNIDPLGHAYLPNFVRAAIADSSAHCHEVCAALHDSEGTMAMLVEPGGMAQNTPVAPPGYELRTFRTATIDSIVQEFALDRLDLIKMDIEGAEPRALAGGMAAIQRLRPQLAISIYHSADQFLEIPLMLARELRDYRFFLRNYILSAMRRSCT